ncbi:MAG: hypothetical protein FWD74_11230 [Actinomycetia bacterium]|nr:hypothetical protein [Actinomycetes bacterium]
MRGSGPNRGLFGWLRRACPSVSEIAAWARRDGHVLLAIAGSVAFMIVRPPVADLQAADARAAAAGRGVGLSYWLSWYSGSTPGNYSVLAPRLTAIFGVTTCAALSVVVMALLARPLLAGARRADGAAYLLVVSALANLWCGRVPLSMGAAFALGGLLVFRRRRPWLGGALAGVSALFSPLAPVGLVLGMSGLALTRPARRGELARFLLPMAVGLAVPAVAFGVPGPMSFPATTLAWTVGILGLAVCLPAPRQVRVSLAVAVLAACALFLIPNGVGANVSRYAYLVAPPSIWALARAKARVVAFALAPAIAYCLFNVVTDQINATHPAAQESFYQGLRTELLAQPGIANHRVEVVDTATHRAAAALVPGVYLARGWEDQSDAAANPIFYQAGALTAVNYRQWLDSSAVAWVAVPSAPANQYLAEAQLVTDGLSYLREVWRNDDWRLFTVADPQPIVSAPARLVSADETSLVVDVPISATVTFRLRPSRYLQLIGPGAPPVQPCLTSVDLGAGPGLTAAAVQAWIQLPGRYRLEAPFTMAGLLGGACS